MKNVDPELLRHLSTGATTTCRCWKVERKDGIILGFTDHDQDLSFDDQSFLAGTGLDASALQTANGLSVDNTEATGALSSEGISEAHLIAGKYDGASVSIYIVNWQSLNERHLIFKGFFGEITHGKNAFTVELRGITEKLNRKMGRNFQKNCSAVLGDTSCRYDLSAPNARVQVNARRVENATVIFMDDLPDLEPDWFVHGTLKFLTGNNLGTKLTVLGDKSVNNERRLVVNQELPHPIVLGDQVMLVVGCDKSITTCRGKFQNVLNFQGFPYIPGEDWMMAVPSSSAT
jgi:uncharacterized phage protein (TIGR02218 family)